MTHKLVRLTVMLDSNEWHGHSSERLWAERLDDTGPDELLRVASSPFFARFVSFGDTVKSIRRSDGSFEYERLLSPGGHSTYMIIQKADDTTFEKYWLQLEQLGCTYESASLPSSDGHLQLYSVDIPPSADINAAYSILALGESEHIWIFQEGHVGH